MQYTYDILPAERLIVLRYTGPVTVPELRRQTEDLWADPLYSLSYKVLADLSQASLGSISTLSNVSRCKTRRHSSP